MRTIEYKIPKAMYNSYKKFATNKGNPMPEVIQILNNELGLKNPIRKLIII